MVLKSSNKSTCTNNRISKAFWDTMGTSKRSPEGYKIPHPTSGNAVLVYFSSVLDVTSTFGWHMSYRFFFYTKFITLMFCIFYLSSVFDVTSTFLRLTHGVQMSSVIYKMLCKYWNSTLRFNMIIPAYVHNTVDMLCPATPIPLFIHKSPR